MDITVWERTLRELYNNCSKDDLIEMVIEMTKKCDKIIQMIADSNPTPPEYIKTVDDHFWELI